MCFHEDKDQLVHAHPPRETEPEGIVVALLSRAHSEQEEPRKRVKSFFSQRSTHEHWMERRSDGAEAYHKAEPLTGTVSWWS